MHPEQLLGIECIVFILMPGHRKASVNAGTALKPAWNLLMYDWKGYGDRTTRVVDGGELVDLGRSSRR